MRFSADYTSAMRHLQRVQSRAAHHAGHSLLVMVNASVTYAIREVRVPALRIESPLIISWERRSQRETAGAVRHPAMRRFIGAPNIWRALSHWILEMAASSARRERSMTSDGRRETMILNLKKSAALVLASAISALAHHTRSGAGHRRRPAPSSCPPRLSRGRHCSRPSASRLCPAVARHGSDLTIGTSILIGAAGGREPP